jgi:penicillin G amidase
VGHKPWYVSSILCFALLLLAGCRAWTFLSYRENPDPPPYQGQMAIQGLKQPVTVVFDSFAIPHIEAQTEEDLYFTVGYLHARERLFQMELFRRVSYGRLAEAFGNRANKKDLVFADTLAIDRWLRTMGLARGAEQAVGRMDPESRSMVESYAAGINAYLQSGILPIEFRLLNFKPEPWQPAHVIATVRLMGWGLSFNHLHELIRFLLQADLGKEQQMEIFPPFEHPGPFIIPREDKDYRKFPAEETADKIACTAPAGATPPDREASSGVRQSERSDFPSPSGQTGKEKEEGSPGPYAAWHAPAQQILQGLTQVGQAVALLMPPGGSNNWVLGPSRTASGKAALANDPHLQHTAPGVFYAVHLRAPGIDTIGATIPGNPAVLLGHSHHLAWSLTAAFADTQDIYLEQVDPNDAGRYVTPCGPETFQMEDHVIFEKRMFGGNREHPFRLRLTRHGPVLNDALGNTHLQEVPLLALRTTMGAEAGELRALLMLTKAEGVEDFKRAVEGWGLPIQNWLVADSSGHIGYWPVGKIPKRVGWDGTMPVPGWSGEFEWDGYIPHQHLPQLFDPPSGLIVTANNKILPAGDYPYPITFDAMPGYRAERIMELLSQKEEWTVEEMRRVQTDVYVKQADRLLPSLLVALKEANLSNLEQKAFMELEGWKRYADVDSVGASIFFATYRMAWELTLKDDLSPVLYQLIVANVTCHGFFDRLWAEVPQARIFDIKDTPARETRDEVLLAAFRGAVKRLAQKLGPDVSKWHWGRLHTLTFKHPFGSWKPLAATFNGGTIPVPGARETVWAEGFEWRDDFSFPVSWGPVFRHVYDFGAEGQSGLVTDLGQSGWPGTSDYRNALPLWKEGKLWSASMDERIYREKALGMLQLTPFDFQLNPSALRK